MRNKCFGFGLALTSAITLATLGLSVQAHAQVITQTETLSSTSADFNGVALTPPINKFNTALGTLNNVTIIWSVNGSIGGSITNLGTGPQTFTVNLDSSVNLSEMSNGSGSLENPDLHTSQSYTNLAPNTPTAYGSFSPLVTGGPTVFTDTATKNFFTGAGNLNLFATSSSTITVIGGNNIQTSIPDLISGTATIVYNYSVPGPISTPEPGSIALFVSAGIGGMGVFVRRRRSK